MTRPELTAEKLRELLHYDPESGLFTRIVQRGYRFKSGEIAGRVNGRGYSDITISGRIFPAHRLVWLYFYGAWPTGEIDHIDGDRLNNRIKNLRDVSRSVNQQNQRLARSDNKSTGLLGVTRRHDKGFQVQIGINGRRRYIGTYATAELAHNAYLVAKRQLHQGCTI
jgi:hypothetical protein